MVNVILVAILFGRSYALSLLECLQKHTYINCIFLISHVTFYVGDKTWCRFCGQVYWPPELNVCAAISH